MPKQAKSMWVGSEDGYEWLVATCSLDDLLNVCPQVVIGRFVAVTAFDSGPLALTDGEVAGGWNSKFGVAYSPRITDLNSLPYDNCYDEWYVFDEPTEIGTLAEQGSNIFEELSKDTVSQFVNYHLGLHLEEQEPLAQLFWTQIRRLQPIAYLADCQSYATLVSKDEDLFAIIREGIQGLTSRS